jgi:hypothetical protein
MNGTRPRSPIPVGWYAEMREDCRGRLWFLRLPVWLYLAYVGWNQFRDPDNYYSLFAAINLGIHEGGHLLFRPFGEFLHIAGGTITQLATPIISLGVLYKQRDYFGLTFCLGWLSTNLIGVGVYMADARAQALPLVTAESGGSSDVAITHDWNYLFGQFGLLDHDETIGFVTRGLGSIFMILALFSGAWVMFEMARPNRNSIHSPL